MKINDSKLYGRVIFGYIIVFFIIACISLIFIYQKIKLEDINNKQYQINLVYIFRSIPVHFPAAY